MSLGAILLLSFGALVVAMAVTVAVVIWLPRDFFTRSSRRGSGGSLNFGQLMGKIAKNIAGVVLLVLGVVLSLPGVPGPGIVVGLLGLALVDFPGKHKLQRKIVRRKRVNRTLNWLRARFGKPAFTVPQ